MFTPLKMISHPLDSAEEISHILILASNISYPLIKTNKISHPLIYYTLHTWSLGSILGLLDTKTLWNHVDYLFGSIFVVPQWEQKL